MRYVLAALAAVLIAGPAVGQVTVITEPTRAASAAPSCACKPGECRCCEGCVCGGKAGHAAKAGPAAASPDRVLYVIGATWCGPCRAVKAILAGRNAPAGVVYLDYQSPEAVRLFGGVPSSLPCHVLTIDGRPAGYWTGGTNRGGLLLMRGWTPPVAAKADPPKPAAVPSSPTLHTHRCPSCGTQWQHVDGSHNCPKCGTYQNVIDHWGPVTAPSRPLARQPVSPAALMPGGG